MVAILNKFTMIELFSLVIILSSLSASAQDKSIIKYYDSLWSPTSRDSAFFYTKFIKNNSLYDCFSYWAETNKLYGRSVYADTVFTKPRGYFIRYYESGQVQDSSYFYENDELKYAYHYYPTGKLWAHYSYDNRTKQETSEGFDNQGMRIKGFIYMKEAEFPGGDNAWGAFLSQNLKTNVPIKNKAPLGTYNVVITFIVSTNGKIIDVKPVTNVGYGMEDEAMRVIKKSPRWKPLILLGEERNAYRRQPVTFIVSGK
jgi:antitoxin component YwqK of YwqJK toxin-antitoxin module